MTLDIDAELGRGELLLARARYAEAIACARAILAQELGDERALDLIDRAEQRAGSDAIGDGEWAPGEVIDHRWTVFGSARGGMGRVYFVRDRAWDNAELAVKSSLEPITGDADHKVRALFRRETQVWLDLGAHPHIVSGYYTLEVRGRLRFFMEFVPGQTLLAVARNGPLALSRVLDFALQLASGVAYVHERGVVHRDLKPANCLVMADDTLRITDFGLGKSVGQRDAARSLGSIATPNLSARGAGTPFYMPPEQWGSLAATERPGDVYAIGVMLWELLAGRRPFEPSRTCLSAYRSLPPQIARLAAIGDPSPELALPLMHAELPPLSLRSLGLAVPAEVDDLILSCLRKAPGDRPSAAVLRAELGRAYHDVARSAPPRPAPTAVEPSAAGESNRALSYEVMGERARAIEILDSALSRDGMAPYPWVNRAAIAIEGGIPPCVYSVRAVSELLPASPGILDDEALRPVFERLARYHPQCPPVMALDVTSAIHVVGCHGQVVVLDVETGRRVTHRTSDVVLAVACLGNRRVAVAHGATIALLPRSKRTDALLPRSKRTDALLRLGEHHDLITGLAASPDGALLASTSNDGTLAVWDVDAIYRPPGVLHTGLVRWRARLRALARSVTWHPRGAPIVTLTTGEVFEFDATGDARCVVRTGASCTAIGPGPTIVVGALDGTLTYLGSHADPVRAHDAPIIAVHATSDVIASADEDGKIRAWGPGGLAAEGPRISGRVRGLRVTPGGDAVVIGNETGGLHIWTLHDTGKWPRAIQRDFPVLEKQRRAEQVKLVVRRLNAGDPSALADGDLARTRDPQHRRDPSLLSSRHHLIQAGGLASGMCEAFPTWATRLPGAATGLALSSDERVAVAMAEGVTILDGRSGAVILHLEHAANVGVGFAASSLVLADDRGRLVQLDHRGMVEWTARWRGTGRLQSVASTAGVVVCGGWTQSMLSTESRGTVRLWRDPGRTEVVFKRMGHTIVSVAISADASVVATGLDDGSSVVWAVDRREIVGSIWGSGEVSAIALSSDVRYLAVGHATGHVRLFLLCAHALPLSSFALQSAPTALSFSADGRWLCGAARDGRVVVLDLPSLGCVLEIQAHSRAAHARISHDNETIITASEDGTVRMWRMIAGWSPPDQIIDEIATRVATHDSIGRSELDVALDAWRVLSRVRSLAGLSARERRRAEELAATIAAKLRATVRPEPAASTAARIRNPYSRVLAVDPTLAALWS